TPYTLKRSVPTSNSSCATVTSYPFSCNNSLISAARPRPPSQSCTSSTTCPIRSQSSASNPCSTSHSARCTSIFSRSTRLTCSSRTTSVKRRSRHCCTCPVNLPASNSSASLNKVAASLLPPPASFAR